MTTTTNPTPEERPDGRRSRAERARRRATRRLDRRAVRRALTNARRTRQTSRPPNPPAHGMNPRPFTDLAELYQQIHRERRTHLQGGRLVIFCALLLVALFGWLALLGHLTPATNTHPIDQPPLRPVAMSTALDLSSTTTTPDHDSPTPARAGAIITVPAGAVLSSNRPSDPLPLCDRRSSGWTDLAPSGDRRHDQDNTDRDDGRWVVRAGPVDVAIDLGVAARRVCDDDSADRGDAHGSSTRHHYPDRKHSTAQDNPDRDGCTCSDPDQRDWPSRWTGPDTYHRPADPTYPAGYGHYRPYPNDSPGTYRPDYQRQTYPPAAVSRDACRAYRPGELPQLPDGGLICIHDDSPPR